jgi:hypothetical protein
MSNRLRADAQMDDARIVAHSSASTGVHNMYTNDYSFYRKLHRALWIVAAATVGIVLYGLGLLRF